MTRKVLRPFYQFILVGLTLILSGCGTRAIGYGVLLWSEDEDLVRSGTVLSVINESDLNDVYVLDAGEEAGEIELARWRVEFFDVRETADAYADEFAEYGTNKVKFKRL